MRGKVDCQLVGGPSGQETITLSAIYCRKRLAIAQEGWFAQGHDGTVNVMKGVLPQNAPWITYSRAIYEKVSPDIPGRVTYRFVRMEDVHRCEKIVESKDRRCKNEAEQGERFCRAHRQVS
jgi:hypothetical protein